MGALHKLSDTKIESRIKAVRDAVARGSAKPVLLGDGGGLTLQITSKGTASWLFRYMRDGKAKAVGLGAYPTTSLRSARTQAHDLRQILAAGNDPQVERRAESAERQKAADSKTFAACAKAYIDAHRAEWKNAKHIQQWENTLEAYVGPVFGSMPVEDVTTGHVVQVLSPIWLSKNETASRLRGRIESVLDWATAHQLRAGDNPARWRGRLEHLLARSTPKSRAVEHHAALPYAQMPAFMAKLAQQDGVSRWALEFLILTAGRTGEVVGCWRRPNIDHPCRLNFDQGWKPAFVLAGCGQV
jgi:Arm DNA-binding domain